MEYEQARILLWKLQDAQVRATKAHRLVRGKGTQAQIDRCLRHLLGALTGEQPTDEQINSARYD